MVVHIRARAQDDAREHRALRRSRHWRHGAPSTGARRHSRHGATRVRARAQSPEGARYAPRHQQTRRDAAAGAAAEERARPRRAAQDRHTTRQVSRALRRDLRADALRARGGRRRRVQLFVPDPARAMPGDREGARPERRARRRVPPVLRARGDARLPARLSWNKNVARAWNQCMPSTRGERQRGDASAHGAGDARRVPCAAHGRGECVRGVQLQRGGVRVFGNDERRDREPGATPTRRARRRPGQRERHRDVRVRRGPLARARQGRRRTPRPRLALQGLRAGVRRAARLERPASVRTWKLGAGAGVCCARRPGVPQPLRLVQQRARSPCAPTRCVGGGGAANRTQRRRDISFSPGHVRVGNGARRRPKRLRRVARPRGVDHLG